MTDSEIFWAETISNSAFESKDGFGDVMVEHGEGDVVVFLHGKGAGERGQQRQRKRRQSQQTPLRPHLESSGRAAHPD